MTASDNAGSMAESRAFAALSMHIEHAAGSTDTLKTAGIADSRPAACFENYKSAFIVAISTIYPSIQT